MYKDKKGGLMKTTCINENWRFYKNVQSLDLIKGAKPEKVNLPHTWNNLDGQDGGNDYFRGTCFYVKELDLAKRNDKDYYLEFRGANAICEVFVNGELATHHEGGFSTFRANVTSLLKDGKNVISVSCDNSSNDRVYPQMADFTFFGGLYRDVYFIEANHSRFDLDYLGTEGITVTPIVDKDKATVTVVPYVTNGEGLDIRCGILFDNQAVDFTTKKVGEEIVFTINNPKLWDGVKAPNLYVLKASLVKDEEVVDYREIRFGIRSFKVDKDGFILNGRRYPLHGVSRHQDRLNMGWAITKKEHEEDMALIKEVGANTIRLAHYQHDQYFYDLADENGMVVWAEIPYISSHLPNGDENAISQMKELVAQNYNHASIVCWGLSNEITIAGESAALFQLHNTLNDICHEMDKTRFTVMANVTMLEPSSKLLDIPDVISYNHYFGWYVGEVKQNAEWLDDFRKNYPNKAIGLSEYGCEAILSWHTSNPKQGDYSEEYQAYYHENMLKIFSERPYLWATHVWNMFDFGVDGRDEGGVKGRNNKGLVTYDRKTKKDSFYIYKAYWTDKPFVHITSKRYVYRAEKVTKIKVYSNQDKVELFVNGKKIGEKTGKYVFEFEVKLPLFAKAKIKAVSGNVSDESVIKRVLKPRAEYSLPKEENMVNNWFEKDGVRYEFNYPEGYFSVRDKLSSIMATEEGDELVRSLANKVVEEMSKSGDGSPVKLSDNLFKLAGSMSIERIAGMAGDKITPEILYQVNEMLNKIPKPKK